MTTMPNFILAGASRCGTTWLQNALNEHQEIALPDDNPVNFFDLRYHRGFDWYAKKLPSRPDGVLVGESSPGYMKNPKVPARVADAFPETRLLFTIRDPVDRAFSEWWHERSFGNLKWEFERALDHHPAFDTFLRPGFYAHFLERFDRHFDDAQMKIMFFEDFADDNEAFIQDAYDFLGVNNSYTPTLVGKRINEANHLSPRLNSLKSWIHHNTPDRFYRRLVRPAYQPIKQVIEADSPYKHGVPDEVRAEMQAVFAEDIRMLEERTGRDLDHWLTHMED